MSRILNTKFALLAEEISLWNPWKKITERWRENSQKVSTASILLVELVWKEVFYGQYFFWSLFQWITVHRSSNQKKDSLTTIGSNSSPPIMTYRSWSGRELIFLARKRDLKTEGVRPNTFISLKQIHISQHRMK